MSIKYTIIYEHGDADMETVDHFVVRDIDLDSEEDNDIRRELNNLREQIEIARTTGRDSHLPDSMLKFGYVEFQSTHFYPELDRWYNQRNLFAAIIKIEVGEYS